MSGFRGFESFDRTSPAESVDQDTSAPAKKERHTLWFKDSPNPVVCTEVEIENLSGPSRYVIAWHTDSHYTVYPWSSVDRIDVELTTD